MRIHAKGLRDLCRVKNVHDSAQSYFFGEAELVIRKNKINISF